MTNKTGGPTKSDLNAQIAWAEGELEKVLTRAQSLREYITATRKLVGKKAPEFEQQNLPGVTPIARRRTKGAALASQVAALLTASGCALHVKDIVKKLAESGNAVIAKNPTNTVAVALIRRPDIFKRVSPNTFDLVAGQENVAETA